MYGTQTTGFLKREILKISKRKKGSCLWDALLDVMTDYMTKSHKAHDGIKKKSSPRFQCWLCNGAHKLSIQKGVSRATRQSKYANREPEAELSIIRRKMDEGWRRG